MNNKRLGNKFEKDFSEFLSKKGYWVHFIEGAAHTGAQPCDIITIRNDCATLFDCKTLNNKNGLFPISRIEENQRLAFKRLKECKNHETDYILAILWNNDIYYILLENIDFEEKSIDLKLEYPRWENFYEIYS